MADMRHSKAKRAEGPRVLGYLARVTFGSYELQVAAATEVEAKACLREEWASIADADKPARAPADFDAYFAYAEGSVEALREGVVEWK